jgi:hypothetical protein
MLLERHETGENETFTFVSACVRHFMPSLRCPSFNGKNFLFWKGKGHERHSILVMLVDCGSRAKDRGFFIIYTSKQIDVREGNNARNRSNEVSRL